MLIVGVSGHQEDQSIGAVVDVQEFPPGLARAPDRDRALTVLLGLVGLADQGWQHMTGFEVKVVPGPVKVGGHRRYEVGAVLTPIGLGQLEARNLRDGVPFVGRLQGAGQKRVLLDRLARQFGIDAA